MNKKLALMGLFDVAFMSLAGQEIPKRRRQTDTCAAPPPQNETRQQRRARERREAKGKK